MITFAAVGFFGVIVMRVAEVLEKAVDHESKQMRAELQTTPVPGLE